ncbi:hypothetical protein BsIDN1_62150 [Bacillus safensis]|uniref:Uncharacterized protein n=1 Tax=Bacillus safensis TaxID=561879 RepID=A0A5S9MGJ1_BACIA|nr:hypothetical protein BsIDN1_62150 [Bacillus safensis]
MQDAENLQKIEQTYEDINKKTAEEASKMSTVKQAKKKSIRSNLRKKLSLLHLNKSII